MYNIEKRQRFTNTIRYAATDTLKTLQAKKAGGVDTGAGKVFISVTRLVVTVVTAGAQALTIRDASSAVILLVIPASEPAGDQTFFGPLPDGVALPANQDLVASTPGAAPAFDIEIEGFFDGFRGGAGPL